jgi:hypothetical protein
MYRSFRSLTWFNLVIVLSLLLSLLPPSRLPVVARALNPVSSLDSSLPPPGAPLDLSVAAASGLADVPLHHLLTNQPGVSAFSGAATYS